MDKALLDTDILSEVFKGRDLSVVTKASAYHAQYGRYIIASITVMEIVKGLHKLQQPLRVQQFIGNLGSLEILSFDAVAGELAGLIYADLERTGQPIGWADPMIAAVAIRHGLLLTTGNTSHYQRIVALGYPLRLDNWRT